MLMTRTQSRMFILIIHSCTALWSCSSSFQSIKFYVSKTKINTASGKYSKGKVIQFLIFQIELMLISFKYIIFQVYPFSLFYSIKHKRKKKKILQQTYKHIQSFSLSLFSLFLSIVCTNEKSRLSKPKPEEETSTKENLDDI